ncbi:GNAT family N-acetyltransferase [Candidatus Neomarinimicrobiota bacterium]
MVPLSEKYVDQLVSWRSLPEAQEHQPITIQNREHFLQFVRERHKTDIKVLADCDYILVIEDAESGKGVGWMTMEIFSQVHGLARIGYTIIPECWNQGFATSALATIVEWLFGETFVERIEADCSIHNPASRRVLEKCGFRNVGIKRKFLVIQGERVDHYYYELLKDDWFNGSRFT